ncbi:MAG: DUF2851 family protein, partial [Sphingobacteriales bacterium]
MPGLTCRNKPARMTERLLHYIWQYQYFNKQALQIEGVEATLLEVIFPGMYNTDQGPDFREARLKIGQHTWV